VDISSTAFGSELITNGDFSAGTTGWSANNATLTVGTNNGQAASLAVADNGGDWSEAYQTVTVEDGELYFLKVDHYTGFSSDWNGRVFWDFGSRTDTEGDGYITVDVDETWESDYYLVIVSGTSLTIRLFSNSTNTAYFDNVSLKKVEAPNLITLTATDSSDNTGTDTINVINDLVPTTIISVGGSSRISFGGAN